MAVLSALYLASGCDFGDAEYLVAAADLPAAEATLAMSANGSILWAENNASPALRAFKTSNGAPVVSVDLDSTGDWGVRDLSAAWEPGSPNEVWVMHHNGYRTRWNTLGGLTSWKAPIDGAEFPADSRNYCLFAASGDGSHFITTGDFLGGETTWYLYRYDAGGSWSRVEASGSGCPDIAYDEPLNQIAVLDYNGFGAFKPVVRWFNATTLALMREQELAEAPVISNDFAAFGYNTAFDLGSDDIGLFDEFGTMTDVAELSHVSALSYRTTPVGPKLAWAGRDTFPDPTFAAGLFALEAPPE